MARHLRYFLLNQNTPILHHTVTNCQYSFSIIVPIGGGSSAGAVGWIVTIASVGANPMSFGKLSSLILSVNSEAVFWTSSKFALASASALSWKPGPISISTSAVDVADLE